MKQKDNLILELRSSVESISSQFIESKNLAESQKARLIEIEKDLSYNQDLNRELIQRVQREYQNYQV